MSTDKQIKANRRNALKSTGPKSEKGKEQSRMNALRHGLTAEQAVLPHEDPRNYDQIRAGMIDAHTPANAAELALVEELVNAYWRLLRLHRVENQYWENLGGSYNRGDQGVAEALIQTPERQTRNFFRYYGQIEKSYYRALAAVNQFQRERRNSKPLKQRTAAAANGFVPQNTQDHTAAAIPAAENPAERASVTHKPAESRPAAPPSARDVCTVPTNPLQ